MGNETDGGDGVGQTGGFEVEELSRVRELVRLCRGDRRASQLLARRLRGDRDVEPDLARAAQRLLAARDA